MQTTHETTPTDAEYERRLGSVLWRQTKPYLDAAQAAETAPLERMAVAQAAAAAKWRAREDLVQQAIDDIGPQLQIEPRHNRVNKVLQRLTGKRGLLYQYDELPPHKVVKRVLKANGL